MDRAGSIAVAIYSARFHPRFGGSPDLARRAGGYGAINIVKSITINGDGTLACILNICGFTGDGIAMNVSAGPPLQLRNVNITETAVGLKVSTATIGQRASVSWDGGRIMDRPVGVQGQVRSNISLRNMTVAGATTGVTTDGVRG